MTEEAQPCPFQWYSEMRGGTMIGHGCEKDINHGPHHQCFCGEIHFETRGEHLYLHRPESLAF